MLYRRYLVIISKDIGNILEKLLVDIAYTILTEKSVLLPTILISISLPNGFNSLPSFAAVVRFFLKEERYGSYHYVNV